MTRIVGIGPSLRNIPWGPSFLHQCSGWMMDWYSTQLYKIAKKSDGNIIAATGLEPGGDEMFATRCTKHQVPLHLFLSHPNIQKNLSGDVLFRFQQFLEIAVEIDYVTTSENTFNLGDLTERDRRLVRWLGAEIKTRGATVLAVTDQLKTSRIADFLVLAKTIGANVITIDIRKFLPIKTTKKRVVIPMD